MPALARCTCRLRRPNVSYLVLQLLIVREHGRVRVAAGRVHEIKLVALREARNRRVAQAALVRRRLIDDSQQRRPEAQQLRLGRLLALLEAVRERVAPQVRRELREQAALAPHARARDERLDLLDMGWGVV